MAKSAGIIAGAVLGCCGTAFALNPSFDINQYAHTSWPVREGFFKGRVSAIAQTPDGYLWLGTTSGLLRFDGFRTAAWQPPAGERLPDNSISKLLAVMGHDNWRLHSQIRNVIQSRSFPSY